MSPVADPTAVAIGFGLMPIAALALYLVAPRLFRQEGLAWGVLAGILAFLGLAHASATALVAIPGLRLAWGDVAADAALLGGLAIGIGAGWLLLGRREPSRPSALAGLAIAGFAFLALHSFNDGLVLGAAFAGPLPMGWPLTAATVGGTLVHRLLEGALLVVPALLLSWKVPKTLTLLLAGLATLPAAYISVGLGSGSRSELFLYSGLSTFLASLEVGFAIVVLTAGYAAQALVSRDRRWVLAAGLAFLLAFAIHLIVE